TTRVATTSARADVPSQPDDPSSETAATSITTTASAAPTSPVSALEIISRFAEGGGSGGFWKMDLYCLPDFACLSVRGFSIGLESGLAVGLESGLAVGPGRSAPVPSNGSSEKSRPPLPFFSRTDSSSSRPDEESTASRTGPVFGLGRPFASSGPVLTLVPPGPTGPVLGLGPEVSFPTGPVFGR